MVVVTSRQGTGSKVLAQATHFKSDAVVSLRYEQHQSLRSCPNYLSCYLFSLLAIVAFPGQPVERMSVEVGGYDRALMLGHSLCLLLKLDCDCFMDGLDIASVIFEETRVDGWLIALPCVDRFKVGMKELVAVGGNALSSLQ